MSASYALPALKRRLLQTLLVCGALGLAGCQSLSNKLITGTEGTLPLARQEHWQLKARTAITTPEDSVAATLIWKKNGETIDFHLFGTLGATYIRLKQQNGQVSLQLPEDKTYYHQNAEELLYEVLGWRFPFSSLTAWVKGIASGAPGEKITRNHVGKLTQIHYQDWQIDFSRYRSYGDYQLPKIIKVENPQLKLKLVVKKWQFLPDPAG